MMSKPLKLLPLAAVDWKDILTRPCSPDILSSVRHHSEKMLLLRDEIISSQEDGDPSSLVPLEETSVSAKKRRKSSPDPNVRTHTRNVLVLKVSSSNQNHSNNSSSSSSYSTFIRRDAHRCIEELVRSKNRKQSVLRFQEA